MQSARSVNRSASAIRRVLLLALLSIAALPAAASAKPEAAAPAKPKAAAPAKPPVIGVGEQSARMFESKDWDRLGSRDVRYVVSWDALHSHWEREETDAYMLAAGRAGARVLVGFGHSRTRSRRRRLPSPTVYRREFLRFRERYPYVKTYLTWNEANHCSQPTCRRPDVAARFHDILVEECKGCTIVGPSVLDKRDMPKWVAQVEKHAKHPIKTWAIHNYIDANRFRSRGTRALLKATKAKIWFTETGGLVRRDNGSTIEFADSPFHAVRAVKWVFTLARLSPRVQRVYFYHWVAPPASSTWDSALLDSKGRPRPALAVIKRAVRAAKR